MACNIGVTAASHFLFIEAANQGGANDSENYIVLDSKGWPMIWKIYWSWEAGGGPLLNILFSCKAGGGPWSEKYIEAEKQEDFTVPHVFDKHGLRQTPLDSIGLCVDSQMIKSLFGYNLSRPVLKNVTIQPKFAKLCQPPETC